MSYNDSIAKGIYNLNIKGERYSKQFDTFDNEFINKYSEDVDKVGDIIAKLYEQSFAYVAVKLDVEGKTYHSMKIDVFRSVMEAWTLLDEIKNEDFVFFYEVGVSGLNHSLLVPIFRKEYNKWTKVEDLHVCDIHHISIMKAVYDVDLDITIH